MKIKVAEPFTGKEEYKSLKKIIYSGKFVSGKIVETFEKNFSKFLGIKYSIGFNSGTAALHAALNCLNLKKNDEVIVPAISFMSTATAVLHNGNTPIFCDVDIDNYCMDPKDFERKITKKTRAVIPVHFAGSACNMNEIVKIAKKRKIKIIEDCAQAHGTKYNNKLVGTFGDISCYSFYATKHMTTGEGGMLCTNSRKFMMTSKIFRSHGMVSRDEHMTLGYNYRMNEIAAQIGIIQLKKLKLMNSKRISNSKFILKSLQLNKKKLFEKQKNNPNILHTFFWCPLRIISKKMNLNKVKFLLNKKGIEIRSRYKKPLYKQKVIQNLKIKSSQNYKKLKLSNAEKLSGKIFGLPNHYKLTKKQLLFIIKTVNNLK